MAIYRGTGGWSNTTGTAEADAVVAAQVAVQNALEQIETDLTASESYKNQAEAAAITATSSVSGIEGYATLAATKAVEASNSATASAASALTSSTQAGIATTKATEAATSASNALTSETNAATSATTATTQASNAATGAGTATTKASEAAASAVAAELSAQRAEDAVTVLDNGTINDTLVTTTDTWSSVKISSEIGATPTTTVNNTLTSTSTTEALSAAQGKVLQDSKQATLVSGTNIKTINGTSVLGGGDLSAGLPIGTIVKAIPTLSNNKFLKTDGSMYLSSAYPSLAPLCSTVYGDMYAPIFSGSLTSNSGLVSCTYCGNGRFLAFTSTTPTQVHTSSDYGATWVAYNLPSTPSGYVADPKHSIYNGVVYSYFWSSNGSSAMKLFISSNFGQTFTEVTLDGVVGTVAGSVGIITQQSYNAENTNNFIVFTASQYSQNTSRTTYATYIFNKSTSSGVVLPHYTTSNNNLMATETNGVLVYTLNTMVEQLSTATIFVRTSSNSESSYNYYNSYTAHYVFLSLQFAVWDPTTSRLRIVASTSSNTNPPPQTNSYIGNDGGGTSLYYYNSGLPSGITFNNSYKTGALIDKARSIYSTNATGSSLFCLGTGTTKIEYISFTGSGSYIVSQNAIVTTSDKSVLFFPNTDTSGYYSALNYFKRSIGSHIYSSDFKFISSGVSITKTFVPPSGYFLTPKASDLIENSTSYIVAE